ncbi:MAG: TAXI family TRAP transporter solute-binding subunit [Kiloniellaceae bacterium]
MRFSVKFTTAFVGAALIATTAVAQTQKPSVFSIAASDVGSYRYAEITAQGEAIDKQFGTKLRVMPLGNAVARASALKTGRTDFWQSCSAYFNAFEGTGDFGAKSWGPQPLRLLLMSNRAANFSPATAKESDIQTLADLKGKRVAWVVGNSGINIQTEAFLAAAGLTLDDVTLVEFPGYSPSVRGLITGDVDMALAANTSPVTLEVASSGAGISWIEIPADDEKAWAAIEKIAPFVARTTITRGAGVEEGQSFELAGYPCPQYLAEDDLSEDKVYWFTKMLVESYDGYKDAITSAPYWQIETAIKSHFAVPYHSGAVRYFKEIGVWSDEMEAQNEKLKARGKVLGDAFAAVVKSFDGSDDDFPAYWEEQRSAALKAAGE